MAHGGARPGSGRKRLEGKLEVLELREKLKDMAPMLINELQRLALKGSTEQTRVTAIKELLDRTYGKAPQAITGEGGEGAVMHEVVMRIIDPAHGNKP